MPRAEEIDMNARPDSKITRVLRHLARGKSLNRFAAEKEVHDHCLHSTISDIERTYGLEVTRAFIEVPGFAGVPTRCKEYWLATRDQRERAWAILGNERPAAVTAGPESGQDCQINVQRKR